MFLEEMLRRRINELIDDDQNGLLFRLGDPRDLKRKIDDIISSPSIIGKLSENRKPMKTLEENIVELLDYYHSLSDK